MVRMTQLGGKALIACGDMLPLPLVGLPNQTNLFELKVFGLAVIVAPFFLVRLLQAIQLDNRYRNRRHPWVLLAALLLFVSLALRSSRRCLFLLAVLSHLLEKPIPYNV